MLWFCLTPQQIEFATIMHKFKVNLKKVIPDFLECFFCGGDTFETYESTIRLKVYKVTRCTKCYRDKEFELIEDLEEPLFSTQGC